MIHGRVDDLTPNGLSSKSAISVDVDGTLSIETQSTTFTSLQDIPGHSSGVITSGPTATALSIGDATTTTFSGEIEGLISLVKQGTGVLTLAGIDTYSGATTVSAGSLVVDGSITSPTEVENTGLLGGQGQVRTVTVDAGGVLSPGGVVAGAGLVGHFSTQAMTLASGATFAEQIGGVAASSYDQVAAGGNVALEARR